MQIISDAPAKHYALDLALTWLTKHVLPILANTTASMCSASLTDGIFPDLLKHAMVQP
jgi:hypothetical protein